jgi:hypothetical protein
MTALGLGVSGVVYVQSRIDSVREHVVGRLEVKEKADILAAEILRKDNEEKMNVLRTELHVKIDTEVSSVAGETRRGIASLGERIDHIHEQLVRREDLSRVETQIRDTNTKLDKFGDALNATLLQLVAGQSSRS